MHLFQRESICRSISTFEATGVNLYVQSEATSKVMGESIASTEDQVIFHMPATGTKTGVAHVGSNSVLFNTTNNTQVLIKNLISRRNFLAGTCGLLMLNGVQALPASKNDYEGYS